MAEITDIRKAPGFWVMRTADAVIGESRAALELHEAGHAPVVYFPPDDVATAFLEPSATTTYCPDKGEASYYHIETEDGRLPDAAWSYRAPLDGAAAIAGFLAVDPDRVVVERV